MKKLMLLATLLAASLTASATCNNPVYTKNAWQSASTNVLRIQVGAPNGFNGCTGLSIVSIDGVLVGGANATRSVQMLDYNCDSGTSIYTAILSLGSTNNYKDTFNRDFALGPIGGAMGASNGSSGVCLAFDGATTSQWESLNVTYVFTP